MPRRQWTGGRISREHAAYLGPCSHPGCEAQGRFLYCLEDQGERWADAVPFCGLPHFKASRTTDKPRSTANIRRGGNHPRAKLTPDQVREIRQRQGAGEPDAHIARVFGITRQAAGQIRRGLIWKSSENPPAKLRGEQSGLILPEAGPTPPQTEESA